MLRINGARLGLVTSHGETTDLLARCRGAAPERVDLTVQARQAFALISRCPEQSSHAALFSGVGRLGVVLGGNDLLE